MAHNFNRKIVKKTESNKIFDYALKQKKNSYNSVNIIKYIFWISSVMSYNHTYLSTIHHFNVPYVNDKDV